MTDEPSRRWDVVDGLKMFSQVSGPRQRYGQQPEPTVVLVHGLGMSSRYMEPLLRQLSEQYRTWAPDLPGIGRSEAPPHLLGTAERATMLRSWMSAVGIESAALVGHSAGCEVARMVAEQDPDRVTCLILTSPAPDPSRPQTYRQVFRLLCDSTREVPSLLMLAARDYLTAGPRRVLNTVRTALRHNRHLRRTHLDGSTAEHRISTPTLVIRGQRDPVVSERWARTVSGLAEHGTLLTLPDAPHALNYTTVSALSSVIRPFLTHHLPPAGSGAQKT